MTLTGCTNAGDTTCAQFNAQDFTKQSETLSDLLTEHDLERYDAGNVQGVTAAVSSLCSSNDAVTLDQATDWDADTW